MVNMKRLRARRTLGTLLGISVWLITCASLASAHGDMVGPDEMGPPAAISAVLGISGYWLMVLWPSRRRRRADEQTRRETMRQEGHGKRNPARS
jgi:hypothetical protein